MIGAAAGLTAVGGGCQLIAGVEDAVPYPVDGGTSTSTGGQGGGPATACAPGATKACYSGALETKGVGICLAGKQTCRLDGSGYEETCAGEVTPKAESCAAAADENCDGHDCVQWAELFGDGADQRATALAVDSKGNIFIVGTFSGEIELNGVKVPAVGSTDAFLLKLDSSGKMLWGKAFGDAGAQEGQAVTVDSTGSVVIGGISATPISLGEPAMQVRPAGLFVVKLSGDGKVLWSNGFGAVGCGGTKDSAIAAMAVTSGNDIVLAGRYCGSIDFGGGPIPSQMMSQDGFVALLGGGTGSAQSGSGWSKVFGDESSQRAVGVAVGGPFGAITIVGDLEGTASFGSPAYTITSKGGDDMFFAKFLASGTTTGTARFGDTDDQHASAIAADTAGNIFISGLFRGDLSFGAGGVTTPSSTSNAYLVKFDSSSSYQWSKSFGGDNFYGTASDIFIDASANIVLSGLYSGSINFGAAPVVAKGTNLNIFLAKLTPTGQPLWLKSFDDGSGLLFGRMQLSPSMDPILTGFSAGPLDLGTGVLTPQGSNDGFVARFAP